MLYGQHDASFAQHVNVVDQNNQLSLQAKLNVGCNWTSPFPKSNGLVSI